MIPTQAPTAKPIVAPASGDIWVWAMAIAASVPERPTTDPTDRSMPPEIITNVIPTDTNATTATWRARFNRFAGDRNAELNIENKQPAPRTPTRAAPPDAYSREGSEGPSLFAIRRIGQLNQGRGEHR